LNGIFTLSKRPLTIGEAEEGEPARVLPEPAGASLLSWAQTQTTYATLLKKEDGSYSVQVVKQKIWVEGVSYELQEIFGGVVTQLGSACLVSTLEPEQ
jgi:E3 ubiquitin-protein ligase MGRN1